MKKRGPFFTNFLWAVALLGTAAVFSLPPSVVQAGTGKIRAIAAALLEELGITTNGVYTPGGGALDDIDEDVKIRTDHTVGFSDSAANTTTIDTLFARESPQAVRVGGSSGYGFISQGQRSQMTARGDTAIIGWGLLQHSHTATSSGGSDADGIYVRQITSGSGTDSDFVRGLQKTARIDNHPYMKMKFKITATSTNRLFIGFSDNATPSSADDPVTETIGLQKRAGDTNWHFINRNLSLTRVDSGVAVDTNVHYVVVDIEADASHTVRLLDNNGLEQASHSFTSDLIADTQTMYTILNLHETSASSTQIHFYYADLQLRPDQ